MHRHTLMTKMPMMKRLKPMNAKLCAETKNLLDSTETKSNTMETRSRKKTRKSLVDPTAQRQKNPGGIDDTPSRVIGKDVETTFSAYT